MAVELEAPHARASARYQHVSPYKVRQVLDLVRGLPVEDAERTLQLCEKDAADDVLKVLESAIANAENNLSADVDELKVQTITVDAAPVLKRFAARAKGRGTRIEKKSCHIYVTVGDAKPKK